MLKYTWDVIGLEEFRGWDFYDWEAFPKNPKGHAEIVRRLKTICKSKYGLKIEKFKKEEAWIGVRHSLRNPLHYVAHVPDFIITNGGKPEDRIVVEYVNTEGKNDQNFLRDLRGMLALSTMMKARGFILAVRNSIFKKYAASVGIHKDSRVEIMSIKSLLYFLDRGDLDGLVA